MKGVEVSASVHFTRKEKYVRGVCMPLLGCCGIALAVLAIRGMMPSKTVVFVIPEHFHGTVSVRLLQVHDGPIIWPWVKTIEVPIHAENGYVQTSLRPLIQWKPIALAENRDGVNVRFEDTEGRPIQVDDSSEPSGQVTVHDLHQTYYGIRFSVGKVGTSNEAVSFSRGMYFDSMTAVDNP